MMLRTAARPAADPARVAAQDTAEIEEALSSTQEIMSATVAFDFTRSALRGVRAGPGRRKPVMCGAEVAIPQAAE